MPFMDHLSKIAKSVGDTAQSAAKKSAEMLEVTKLNMSIQTEQDKIKALKTEIGDIVFSKFEQGGKFDENMLDILETCSKIVAAQDNINAIQHKIAELKNVKLCCKCGNELPLAASFCQKCGTKQPEETAAQQGASEPEAAEPEKNICPDCKGENPTGSTFCTFCGKKLTE